MPEVATTAMTLTIGVATIKLVGGVAYAGVAALWFFLIVVLGIAVYWVCNPDEFRKLFNQPGKQDKNQPVIINQYNGSKKID